MDCAGFATVWQETAAGLHGVASVGVVDVTNFGANKTGIDDAWLRFGITSVPLIVIFKGHERKDRRHAHFLEEDTIHLLRYQQVNP